MISGNQKRKILKVQKSEITEHLIYQRLASVTKDEAARIVLENVSAEEFRHYEFWKGLSGEDVPASRMQVFFYFLIARLLGLNFGIKLMERGEGSAQENYAQFKELHPRVEEIINDEERHEQELIGLIREERLKYVGSIVLGLNDALVELTGALAGFTLALRNSRLVAVVGLITGISASLSMAASEYLSTRQEDEGKSPLKASIYTGIAYVLTVIFLILPYFLLENVFFSLFFVVINAILIVFLFTFYISVSRNLDFKKRFLEMTGISLGVALISFAMGFLVRRLFSL
ncbi:VIT1/CCC1 transporter family protein [Candidatus Omnitrophota bacterium]